MLARHAGPEELPARVELAWGRAAHADQAEDGAIALECIRKKTPDLVLADWNMPNMNGIGLLEELRAEKNDVTFGFITTESTQEMREKAMAAGAQFLIAKPFTVDSFEKVLSTIMQ